jgi:hypothetical protein
MSSGVEFEEDNFSKNYARVGSTQSYSNQNTYSNQEERGIIGWLIKHNLAKSKQSAQYYLLGIIAVNLLITSILIIYFL